MNLIREAKDAAPEAAQWYTEDLCSLQNYAMSLGKASDMTSSPNYPAKKPSASLDHAGTPSTPNLEPTPVAAPVNDATDEVAAAEGISAATPAPAVQTPSSSVATNFASLGSFVAVAQQSATSILLATGIHSQQQQAKSVQLEPDAATVDTVSGDLMVLSAESLTLTETPPVEEIRLLVPGTIVYMSERDGKLHIRDKLSGRSKLKIIFDCYIRAQGESTQLS